MHMLNVLFMFLLILMHDTQRFYFFNSVIVIHVHEPITFPTLMKYPNGCLKFRADFSNVLAYFQLILTKFFFVN